MDAVARKSTRPAAQPVPSRRPAVRALLAMMGLLFTGLGAVGVLLPGIPTVGPLLLASWCFSKSFPRLEQVLLRNRFFRGFSGYLDGDNELSARGRIASILVMWAGIGISLLSLYGAGWLVWWMALLLLGAGLAGTWFISQFRRIRPPTSAADRP